jgi:hypothetical protein
MICPLCQHKPSLCEKGLYEVRAQFVSQVHCKEGAVMGLPKIMRFEELSLGFAPILVYDIFRPIRSSQLSSL